VEKAEYWALIWGTLVMGFTGFFLWFPTMIGDWAPLWFIKVCEIVHYYEAILATLAIVVWHWFFVIFRPQEYPLSFTTIDGKMTITHFKGEHTLRFKKIIIEYLKYKSGKLSQKQISHFTAMFIKALKKHNVEIDQFVKEEINNDEKLKKLVDDCNLSDSL